MYLDTNVDGDTWYVDKDSIKVANFTYGGKYTMAWLKVDFAKAQDDGDGKKYWQVKTFAYYDCTARKSDIDYFALHDKQGRIVRSDSFSASTHSSADWNEVIPNTNGDDLITYVCSVAGR